MEVKRKKKSGRPFQKGGPARAGRAADLFASPLTGLERAVAGLQKKKDEPARRAGVSPRGRGPGGPEGVSFQLGGFCGRERRARRRAGGGERCLGAHRRLAVFFFCWELERVRWEWRSATRGRDEARLFSGSIVLDPGNVGGWRRPEMGGWVLARIVCGWPEQAWVRRSSTASKSRKARLCPAVAGWREGAHPRGGPLVSTERPRPGAHVSVAQARRHITARKRAPALGPCGAVRQPEQPELGVPPAAPAPWPSYSCRRGALPQRESRRGSMTRSHAARRAGRLQLGRTPAASRHPHQAALRKKPPE
jgi:hypothetical protein